MKIEWTDAAVECATNKYARLTSSAVRYEHIRAALDEATAEQFRPETAEEKCKRLEAVLRQLREVIGGAGSRIAVGGTWYNGLVTACDAADAALAGPNSKES